MKQKIYENKFADLFYNSQLNEVEYIYFDTTQHMTDENYYDQLLAATEAMEKVIVHYIIIDFREFGIPLVPEIQDKVVQHVVPRWIKMGLKKVAIIMPAEFIANLSVEQMVDDSSKLIPYQIKYFDSFESARQWFYH